MQKYFISITLLIVILLSQLNAQPNMRLLDAIKKDKLSDAVSAVNDGADVNARYKNGYTALMVAVINERMEIIKYLIEKGAKINESTNNGKTALDLSINERINDLLINKGAIKGFPQKANNAEFESLSSKSDATPSIKNDTDKKSKRVNYIPEKIDSTGTVKDIDGNLYKTVKIGNQWWMAENLKVTRYNNGDHLHNRIRDIDWNIISIGAYCDYGNSAHNGDIYGHLYNWYAVNDARRLAPEGWHVPSIEEWAMLVEFLGGDAIAGGKIKQTGTVIWTKPNEGATNESGFTALPGGNRSLGGSLAYSIEQGQYFGLGYAAAFWASTKVDGDGSQAWLILLSYIDSLVQNLGYYKGCGFSVRCIKN